MIQKDGRTRDPLYKNKNRQNKILSMKHSFPISRHVWEGNSSKNIICFTPNRDLMPSPTLQNLLVWKSIIEGARIMLQSNTSNI